MAQKKKSGILFLLGAAVGAAAGYYLNSESGRKLRTETSNKANELAEKAEARTKEGIHQFKSGFDSAVEKSKEAISEASETVKERLARLEGKSENILETAENAYQRGAEEARSRINQKASEIEDLLETKKG
ncbi:YtxH domain-containing protein [Membranicola marinus]|uniref:YtxH domain-containing protein n=1 Tax=Membranihabitans marinus TaxID=1227546 RepID=A0A953LD43_9BACT|nr:YtxH domain-containing protein [Membranihabitans marinus]MBY5960176.1 YtxH domain-containing protein [Membranihabitans marinus]